jgi:O-antigen ligase
MNTPLKPAAVTAASSSSAFAIASSLAVALTLAGFQIASFLVARGYQSRIYMVPFRLGTALLLVTVLVTALVKFGIRFRFDAAVFAVAVFWVVYSARLLVNVGVGNEVTSPKGTDLMQFAYGVSLLGFVAFLLVRDPKLYNPWALRFTTVAFLLASLLSLRYMLAHWVQMVRGETEGNEILNHISLGHTGASLTIIGAYLVLRKGGSPWNRPWGVVVLVIGLVVVVLSTSRGSAVALSCVLLLLMWFGWRSGRRVMIGITIALMVTGASVVVITASSWGLPIKSAFSKVALLQGASTTNRERYMTKAIDVFTDNPVWGCCVNVPGYHVYPHNLVVESFMATGVLGGIPFLALLALGSWRALGLVRHRAEVAWLGMLFFQYVLAAMFSGSLYTANIFWALLGIVIGLDQGDQVAPRPAHIPGTGSIPRFPAHLLSHKGKLP